MKKSANKSKRSAPSAEDRARMTAEFISGLEQRGELDPNHGKEFGLLFDDVAPTIKPKKAKKK
jgi:hypothetical protein